MPQVLCLNLNIWLVVCGFHDRLSGKESNSMFWIQNCRLDGFFLKKMDLSVCHKIWPDVPAEHQLLTINWFSMTWKKNGFIIRRHLNIWLLSLQRRVVLAVGNIRQLRLWESYLIPSGVCGLYWSLAKIQKFKRWQANATELINTTKSFSSYFPRPHGTKKGLICIFASVSYRK